MKLSLLPLSLACLLFTTPPSQADFITGQVVDSFGVGVSGVDIDIKNLGSGGTPNIFNDGTDASGFFTTTMPAGFYRVTFTPPAPPLTSHLITEVDDVIVVGTTNMGVIQLPPGVLVSGRVRNSAGLPVAGVNLDVIEIATGDNLALVGDTTDAFGQFVIASPATSIELRFKTVGVPLQVLAPLAIPLQLNAGLALGDVVLEPGYHLFGRVVGPGGIGVDGADFDLKRTRNGTKLFTPGDNTSPTGNFSIVVPAGVFDVNVCAVPSDRLVGQSFPSVQVQADFDLGLIQLAAGVVLSGTVRAFDGTIISGADIDVKNSNGKLVQLGGDSTNGAGFYSVIVPTGTLKVSFAPPGFSLPYAEQDVLGVSAAGDLTLNGSLPTCPFSTPIGTGSAGSGGIVPSLTSTGGAPRADNKAYGFNLTGALGGAPAFLSNSFTGTFGQRGFAMPGFGSALGASQPVVFHGTTLLGGTPGVAGSGSAFFPLPVDNAFVGITTVARVYVLDANAGGSLSSSNGLVVTFCD